MTHKLNARDARNFFHDQDKHITKNGMDRYLKLFGPITHCTCRKCHFEKTIKEFHINSSAVIGYVDKCKTCLKIELDARSNIKKNVNSFGFNPSLEGPEMSLRNALIKAGRTYSPMPQA